MSQKAIASGKRERRSQAMRESHAKEMKETRELLQSLQKVVEKLGVSPGTAIRLIEENQMLSSTLRLMEESESLPKLTQENRDEATLEFYVPPFPDGWAPIKHVAPVFVTKFGNTFAKIPITKLATKGGR